MLLVSFKPQWKKPADLSNKNVGAHLEQQPLQMFQLGFDCTAVFSQFLHISTKTVRQEVRPDGDMKHSRWTHCLLRCSMPLRWGTKTWPVRKEVQKQIAADVRLFISRVLVQFERSDGTTETRTQSEHQQDGARTWQEVTSPLAVVVKLLHSPAQLPPRPLSHVMCPTSICTGDTAAGRSKPQRLNQSELSAGLSTQVTWNSRVSDSAATFWEGERNLASLVPLNSEESSELSASNMRSSSSRSQESRWFKMS